MVPAAWFFFITWCVSLDVLLFGSPACFFLGVLLLLRSRTHRRRHRPCRWLGLPISDLAICLFPFPSFPFAFLHLCFFGGEDGEYKQLPIWEVPPPPPTITPPTTTTPQSPLNRHPLPHFPSFPPSARHPLPHYPPSFPHSATPATSPPENDVGR